MSQPPVRRSFRLLSYLICALIAGQPLLPAVGAALTPQGGTSVDSAGNGVPVVNIATPNGAGISHNQFQDYNVGKEGLILNNATDKLNATQLGGLIQSNPNLKAGQEARGIINEVTGGSRSQLQGYTEVAGKAANVMVANPYGITCNGCGFINTPQATLTTGKPVLDAAGNLQALEVSKGTITIEGQGLDASNSDALAIISRATEVNAAIHANDLTVIAGANRVAADGSTRAISGEGAAPSVAVDTGALGGMYANRIRLVSGDTGVGVNLGNLNARQGDIQLEANGRLTVRNSLASGALTAKGAGVTLTGNHQANGAVQINSTREIALNNGTLTSGGAMQLNSDGALVATNGTLSTGRELAIRGGSVSLDADSKADAVSHIQLQTSTLTTSGEMAAGGDLTIAADTVSNDGKTAAGGRLTLQAGELENRGILQGSSMALRGDRISNGGSLFADGSLEVNAGALQQNGMLVGNGVLSVAAGSLVSGKDSRTTSQGEIRLTAALGADLDGQIDAAGPVSISATTLTTQQNAHLQSGQALTLMADNAGLYGIHAAKTELLVSADTLVHGGKSTASLLRFTGNDRLTNSGELTADGIALSAKQLIHSGVAKADRIGLTAADGIDNSGTLLANSLSLESATIVNGGLLQGDRQLSLLSGSLSNLAGGSLYSAADLTLAIPTLDNRGLIATDGALWLQGTSLANQGEINGASLRSDYRSVNNLEGGRLLADDQLSLNGVSLDNGGILSATTLLLTLAQQASNGADGQLIAGDGLTLTAADIRNSGLLAGTDVQLNGTTLSNSGTLQGTQRLTATGERLSNQRTGRLLSGGELVLRHAVLNNAGLLQGNTLNLATGEWINDGNALGDAAVTATVSGALTNSGKVLSQQTSDITAATLDNRGQLLAQVLLLQGDLQNSGLLQGSRALNWSGESLSNQTQGQIASGETLVLRGKTLTSQGQLQARSVTLDADTLTNDGTLQAQDALSVSLTGVLNNQGELLSQNLFELTAARLFNQGKLAGKTLTLAAGEVTNNGLLQGNTQLMLTTTALFNNADGQLVSGSGLDLTLDRLENSGLLLVNKAFTVNGNALVNRGQLQADSLDLHLSQQLDNQGSLVAANAATLTTTALSNGGTLAADRLSLRANDVNNGGLMQGSQAVDIAATRFINQLNGKWLAGGTLSLQGATLSNDGVLQGATLVFTGGELSNNGTINGLAGLTGTLSGALNNSGLLQSSGEVQLTADALINPGRIMGDTLSLAARELVNNGLWQGENGLRLSGETLTTGNLSRTLTAGLLTLDAGQMTTQGMLQGTGVTITTGDWDHGGSLVSQGALTVNSSGTLTSTGALMSQGGTTIAAQTLDNRGQILSEEAITLSGDTLSNSGTVQGNALTLQQTQITNQGTLTGLQSLTIEAQRRLMARLAMAAPQQTLINAASGKLLTQGTLSIASGTVSNEGSWQGQAIQLTAQSLDLSGAVQSADALHLTLTDNLTARAGSSITALGTAALEAASLSNQGQWAAKDLMLKSGSLDNSGAISGVDALTLIQTGGITQQQSGSLLTGGALSINAASVSNAGKMQGATLDMTSGALNNSGRIQGDNGATLTLSGTLTNAASGEIISRDGLTLTTPTLINSGTIQGGGATRLTTTTQLRNDGRLLSGAALTLNTPEYLGAGWLQAADLTLNAATATNGGGTWIADRATLTGTTFSNQGTTQAGTLAVNYSQLTNGGTLLGNSQLNVTADRVNQTAGGKLLSGGDLWLKSKGLDILGQLVALGNLTLQLSEGFTSRSAIAAGKTLTISSGGAIDNRSVMQGQAIALSADGQLSNSGQITTGSGASTLSGSSVALTGLGSVQGGGDISVIGRSTISVDGFTGTRGSLTLSAPGAIVNTALLYAANNLMLYADAISNQRGDIMAGNSLWMQKDAAGNANSQVVNTSGNIETTNGDITIKTARLLNERAGLSISNSDENFPLQYAWLSQTGADVPLSYLDSINYAYGYYRAATGCANGCAGAYYSTPAPWSGSGDLRFAVSRTQLIVNSDGSPAARIVSGRDMLVGAGSLENNASNMLAARNIALSGSTLDNHSWMAGTQTRYLTYRYTGENYAKESTITSQNGTGGRNSIYFAATGNSTLESTESESYRAVIQAGGSVMATFSSQIGNTSTTANNNGVTHLVATPALNTLSNQTISNGAQKQNLTTTGSAAVNSPQWRDQLQNALQQINGGGSLETSGVAKDALSTLAPTAAGDAGLGKPIALVNGNVNGVALNQPGGQQGKTVDTSAYPLPSGQNGYFVVSDNPKSPYLISINPKLNNLGELNSALFDDLNTLLGSKPGTPPLETRTRFTDENQFLGSAYMLGRLNLNPEVDYRFLGDAAFDTRYVSNALLNQTGNRYINGIGSDLAQMRYLMDNAASAQQSLGLTFGVALTADQIAALDHSILWWESATINGETVMIPKLYLSPKDISINKGSVIAGNNVTLSGGEIANGGSSLLAANDLTLDSQNSISNLNAGLMKAGGTLDLNAVGDINNIGSTISGKTVALESQQGSINNLTLTDRYSVNEKGRYDSLRFTDTQLGDIAAISAQESLSLSAGNNIIVTGASLAAGGDMLLNAWGNIAVNANEVDTAYHAQKAGTDRTSTSWQGSTVSAGGDLVLKAGQDITTQAAALAAEGNVGMLAGGDVNLLAAASSESSSSRQKKKTAIDESVRQQGSEIASGGNTTIIAGRDVNAEAAQVTASGDIALAAGRDVNLTTATESDYRYREETKTKKGFLSKKTTHTIEEDSATREVGSLLSGDNVSVSAGNNLLVHGSAVAGDGNVALEAGNNVDIVAATNTDTSWRFKETKKSGLMGSGGIGFTIGSSKTTHDLRDAGTTQSQSFSTVGSTGGSVAISAGNQAHIGGADLIAQQNLSVSGDSVLIEPGHDKRRRDETFEQKSSGLTIALSGAVGGAINNAVSAAQSAHDESDSRLAALQATKAALSGVQAGQAVAVDAAKSGTNESTNAIGISATLSTQKSKSEQHLQSDTVAGSSLTAGNNLAVIATGKGSSANSGDILIAGSQLKAGGNTLLDADNDLLLSGAANTQSLTGKNSSSGGGVGVGIGVGSGGWGISVFANGNAAHGKEKGNGTDWTETTVDSGNGVIINSGRDAILNGAQVSGKQIAADIGRDLLIGSQQNNNDYDSKQSSVAAGGSFTFGSMSGSGYVSVSQDKMKSRFDSVQEQSGLFAGDGGYDITVGNHTQLDGAVIASTATADKNKLDTGTLGFSDLHNEADFKTQHSGGSFNSGGNIAGQFASNMANALTAGGGSKGHAEGTTQAAVSDGTIIIRNPGQQQQDVANLSRDTVNANDSISPIFDKEKEQKRLQEVQLIADVGAQAGDVARTQGDLAGRAARKDPQALAQARQQLESEGQAVTDASVAQRAYNNASAVYGTGSDVQRGIQAATGALTALASGGNLGAILGSAAAPELAHLLKGPTEGNPAAKAIAHALLGGAVAALQGQSAASGAAGAAAGDLAAMTIMNELYPGKDVRDLSEGDKQYISNLATLAAGLAGNLASGTSAGTTAGAKAGKNAAENNAASNWGGLVPTATQQDAALAFDLGGKGVTNDKIIKAVEKSHIGPSVGDTAKIHGDVKGQVAAGYLAGGFLEGVLSEDKFAINGGVTKVIGWRADASAGLTFGPYPIKGFNPAYDYAGAISTGIFSFEGSVGKDGIGGSFRIGGGIGASLRQSEHRNDGPDLSGSGSSELISWPIKKD